MVAGPNAIAILELLSGPELKDIAAHHVERRFMICMHMGLGARAGWECHQAEPDHLGPTVSALTPGS